MDCWNVELRKAVQALILEMEGKPCVNVGDYDGGVYVCRRISGLHTDDDSFNGQCEWVEPEDSRPDELTDGMSISCDCVRLGIGWWQDAYFRWYFVYDPELVARSLVGDHSWVRPFLDSNMHAIAEPAPASAPSPGPVHRLRPWDGCAIRSTEDVVRRLQGAFAFMAAQPHSDATDTTSAGLVERTFSIVLADNADTLDYVSFEVRPGDSIRIGFRNEQHQAATRSLVERCARLLDYEVVAQ